MSEPPLEPDEPTTSSVPPVDAEPAEHATDEPLSTDADAPPMDAYGDADRAGYDEPIEPLGEGLSRPVTLESLKQVPHSVEAEQSVLGGLMMDPNAWYKISDKVAAEDFYRDRHQRVFEAMQLLSETNQQLDPVTIKEKLVTLGTLQKAGGIGYLMELYEATPGVSNIEAYAQIVRDRATLRRLISTAQAIADRAFRPDGLSSDELLAQAENQIFQIAEGRLKEDGPKQVAPLLKLTVKRVQELADSGSRITGLPTGFSDLDDKTAGLQRSDLVIVAGRPSMGKTSFAMNLVEEAVMNKAQDGAVLVFSLEMPADLLLLRMVSSLGRIDQTRLRTGELKDQEWDGFTSAVAQLRDRPLFIDDSPNLSPNDLRARAHRVRREQDGKLKLIMVDYLQLMRGSGQADNRTGEISEISRSLKALAKEMGCPVIALSQLNRALENRTDRRPVMADLRESGAIEQDADVILFIYRDEVYNEESPDKGVAEIIIGKQRNGPTGTVKLAFLGHLTKFENLAPSRYDSSGYPTH
ncbi:MAG: replicative DNA helicase [Pseudomonadota bacterium]